MNLPRTSPHVRTDLGAIAMVAIIAGCSALSPSGPTGPLALIPASQGDADAWGGEGTVNITPSCVVLLADDRPPQTLIWRANEVEWQAASGAIIFSGVPGGETLIIKDGDRISVGGQTPHDPGWVVAPDPECPADLFTVHSVEKMD